MLCRPPRSYTALRRSPSAIAQSSSASGASAFARQCVGRSAREDARDGESSRAVPELDVLLGGPPATWRVAARQLDPPAHNR